MATPETPEIGCFTRLETHLFRWAKRRFFENGEFNYDPNVFEPIQGGISCFCNAHEGMTPEEAKRRAHHKDHNKPGILELQAVEVIKTEGITGIRHTDSEMGSEHADIVGAFEDATKLQSIQLELLAISTVVLGPGLGS